MQTETREVSSAAGATPADAALVTIARSVAYLALVAAELTTADLATKAAFLERLGLSRNDCARVLETTPASLRGVASRRRKNGNTR
jgi:hypothetical protein